MQQAPSEFAFASVSLYKRDAADGVQNFSWLADGSQGRRTSRRCRFTGITSEGFDAVSRPKQSRGKRRRLSSRLSPFPARQFGSFMAHASAITVS